MSSDVILYLSYTLTLTIIPAAAISLQITKFLFVTREQETVDWKEYRPNLRHMPSFTEFMLRRVIRIMPGGVYFKSRIANPDLKPMLCRFVGCKVAPVAVFMLVLVLTASALGYEDTAGTLLGFALFYLAICAVFVLSWLARRMLYRRATHDYGEGEASRAAFWWQISQADTIMSVLVIFVFFLASVKVLAQMVRSSNGGEEWTIEGVRNHTYRTLDANASQGCPSEWTGAHVLSCA